MFVIVPASVKTANVRFMAAQKAANKYESKCHRRGAMLAMIMNRTKNARIQKKCRDKLVKIFALAEQAILQLQDFAANGCTKADIVQMNASANLHMAGVVGRKDHLVTQFNHVLYNQTVIDTMLKQAAADAGTGLQELAHIRQELSL